MSLKSQRNLEVDCRWDSLWQTPLLPGLDLRLSGRGLHKTDGMYGFYWDIYLSKVKLIYIFSSYYKLMGARGSVVVKALCYKPEGRGFDTRWGDF
jgi:hypothetical protein